MAPQSGKSMREIQGKSASTASTSDSVFIIIDAQNFYAAGPLEIVDLEKSRPNVLAVLNKYRAVKGDIIHVVHGTPSKDSTAAEGSSPEDIFPELAPLEGETVVVKNRISSFAETNLQETIEKLGKKKLVLAGYQSHVCVSTTARAGNDLGYDVLIVSDAVGDRDIPGVAAAHLIQVALAELGDAFATIIKSSDIS